MEAKLGCAQPSASKVSALVIHLEGEFDLAERDRLMDAFAIAQNTPVVIVNLERSSYIDSSVLQCLMALHLSTQKRGTKLILLGVHGTIRRLLEVTRTDALFDVRNTLSDVPGIDGQARRLTIESRQIQ